MDREMDCGHRSLDASFFCAWESGKKKSLNTNSFFSTRKFVGGLGAVAGAPQNDQNLV